MRITLSGDLGSGKSSVGRRLAATLGVPHFSAGTLFREIGQISNLDALQTNLAAEDNVEIDYAVDNRTRELNQLHESFIIDSRMAWHFVANATRVYLSASPKTAARRVTSDTSRSGETYPDLASATASLEKRRASEVRRYLSLYQVDITDVNNYDLFIITDDATVEDIADVILAFANRRTSEKFWLPKPRIVPMIDIGEVPRSVMPARAPLRLVIAENFGFYFDDAPTLVTAVKQEKSIVPYAPKPRAAEEEDVIALARRRLREGGLREWEESLGFNLSFAKCVQSRMIGQ